MSKVLERWPKPVRSALESRPTLVLKEPLVRSLPLKGQASGFFAAEREPGWNSVDINAYVSKIRFNLDRKTINVYGKDGKLIWGVIDQYAVRP